MSSKPLKFDADKIRLELIPPEFIEATGRGLTYGANKYTTTEFEKFWRVVSPDAIDLYDTRGCVVRITRSGLENVILTTPKGSDRIDGTGRSGTESICLSSKEGLLRLQKYVNENVSGQGRDSLSQSESPLSSLTSSYKEAVKCAEAWTGCTLITTMSQGSTVAFCATNITSVLDCLVTTLKELKPCLGILNADLSPTSGAGNWAVGDGFEWSRLYGGLLRHLNSWNNGEDVDPESGNHHLDHACCMLAFLVAHVRRNHGKDDRQRNGVAPLPPVKNTA